MRSSTRVPLRVLTGPTASGKTRVALELARARGLEVLSADSMCVYRRMDIGTAKPSACERTEVPHHCVDLVEPCELFDSSLFATAADAALVGARERGTELLVVGGTPLYLMSLLFGFFDGPRADRVLREELRAREAAEPGALHAELGSLDPAAAARIHRNDTMRLVRALEVAKLTGRPISELQGQFDAAPRHAYRACALELPRETLKERVRARTSAMLDAGLVDEVRAIHEDCGFSTTAAAGIGYREVLAFLDGSIAADDLEYKIRSATHRLVRRQATWFRRLRGLVAVPAQERTEDSVRADVERVLFGPEAATS